MSKLAFVFAGQGAQYPGMGLDFYKNFETSKKIFDTADHALGYKISEICFDGTAEQLSMTEITQPAVLTTTVAILDAILEKIQSPDMVAGLSLGEYSALVCANAIQFQDAVKLVRKRGKYMQEAVPVGVGTMAAIMGLDSAAVQEVCQEASQYGIVEPSNFNCPGQIVIGGEVGAIQKACEIAKEKGAKRATQLSVSAPFHTSMLERAAEMLWRELQGVEISHMNIPVVSNTNAEVIGMESKIMETLVKQVMSPVLWESSIRNMIAEGVTVFVEIGPGKTLTSFIKKISKDVTVMNVEDMASYEETIKKLEEMGYGKNSSHYWSQQGHRETDSRQAI